MPQVGINFNIYTSKSITIVCVAIVMLLLLSCGGKKQELGEAITERDSLPVMSTLGVTSFVSDSGLIRYKIVTDEWLVFDRKRPSFWAFEKGVYLEQFDSLFNVDASIKADTAYFFDKERLWKLIGNVEIKNLKDEHFTTELLYWNQATQKVYSDKFVRIEQPDRIIQGYGFESDQQLNNPIIQNVEGIFYVDQEETRIDNDTTTISETPVVIPDTIQ